MSRKMPKEVKQLVDEYWPTGDQARQYYSLPVQRDLQAMMIEFYFPKMEPRDKRRARDTLYRLSVNRNKDLI